MEKGSAGRIIVIVSLLVIATTSWLSFEHHQASRLAQLRAQSASVAKLLSTLGWEMVASNASGSALDLVQSVHAQLGFAYVALTNLEGEILLEASEPTVNLTLVPFVNEPRTWHGERTVSGATSGQVFREFQGPLMAGGQPMGHVRIGYREPGFGLAVQNLSFYVWLALPVALLALTSYYLLKVRLRLLRKVAERLHAARGEEMLQPIEVTAAGEAGELLRSLNQTFGAANDRVRVLKEDQNEWALSSKVLSYQKAVVESVLHSIPHAIMVMDEAGDVVFANSRTLVLFGLSSEQILGRNPNAWCSSSELLAFLARCSMTAASQELEIAAGKAVDKDIEVSAFPLFSVRDATKIQGKVIFIRDVTKEVLARNARKEFVAHLGHELKTPLQVISMYSETLLENTGSPPDLVVEAGNVIHDEAERISSLVKNMLNITEMEMGSLHVERGRTKLRELLQDAFDIVARSAKRDDLRFTFAVPNGLSAVNIDKDLTRIAINNLLTNAIKYNRPGGQVTLDAEETGDAIVVSVTDTGIGISEDDRARLFDKFYRSTRPEVQAKSGNGLGLALAQNILALHQGEIRVDSTLGVGSKFSLVFPKNAQLLLKEAV